MFDLPVRTPRSDLVDSLEFSTFAERYAIIWRSIMQHKSDKDYSSVKGDNGHPIMRGYYSKDDNGHSMRGCHSLSFDDITVYLQLMYSSNHAETYCNFVVGDYFQLNVGGFDIAELKLAMKDYIGDGKRENVLEPHELLVELFEFADDYFIDECEDNDNE